MRTRTLGMAAACILILAESAPAQGVVQLPTFGFFAVNTTVSVPDSGGMLLGGNSRAYSGRTSTGVPGLSQVPGAGRLFADRAIGSELAGSSLTVSATIHDREAMEAALFAAAARSGDVDATRALADRKAEFLTAHVGRTSSGSSTATSGSPLPSVAEIRRHHDAAKDRQETEARDLFEQGEQAIADGKPNVAKIFFQMASRRSIGPLKERAQARLATLAPAAPKVAQRPAK